MPVAALFGFHERADALARLTPPWEPSEVLVPPRSLEVGTVVVLRTHLGPLPMRLEAEHVHYERGVEFRDRMRRGPFAHWLHRHRFFDEGDASVLVDDVTYALPFEPFSAPADALVVRPRLARLFAYRHAETARALGVAAPEELDPSPYLSRS